jgi:hypothetical protein
VCSLLLRCNRESGCRQGLGRLKAISRSSHPLNGYNQKAQSCLKEANRNNTQTNEQNVEHPNEQNGEQIPPPPLWSSAFDGTKFLWPITDTPARVRLLRVILRKNNSTPNNQSSDISSLLDLFSQTQTASPPFSDNPPDAKGMILGISKPFPWHIIERLN